jgi:hypothetical protein
MPAWHIAGTYYETCNCMAVCPCRRLNGRSVGRSTFGICQGLLSWSILRGECDGCDLSGRRVAMAIAYDNDEPGSPWRIVLYVDEDASPAAEAALQAIFSGRAGGTIRFTSEIGDVVAMRKAAIELDHRKGRELIAVRGFASGEVERAMSVDGTVTCGIPGHDRLGVESISRSEVRDGPLSWSYEGRCGFATDFEYHS